MTNANDLVLFEFDERFLLEKKTGCLSLSLSNRMR